MKFRSENKTKVQQENIISKKNITPIIYKKYSTSLEYNIFKYIMRQTSMKNETIKNKARVNSISITKLIKTIPNFHSLQYLKLKIYKNIEKIKRKYSSDNSRFSKLSKLNTNNYFLTAIDSLTNIIISKKTISQLRIRKPILAFSSIFTKKVSIINSFYLQLL